MAFNFTSPYLKPEHRLLRECPTGAILRETPYIYDVIAAHSYAENGAIDPLAQTHWLQEGMRVVGAEKSRLWEIDQKKKQTQHDAHYGSGVLRRGT